MTPDLLRRLLRYGVAALVLLAPLPFGSVRAGAVLAIELWAAALGLVTIYLLSRDDDARATLPRAALWICGGVIALGIFQIVPLPFSIAEKFNPTAELVRPLIPYLGLPHPPSVAWSVAAPETTDALLRFIAYVLIGLAASVAFDDTASRRRFAIVLVVAAVFQAVYGSGEYLSGRQHIFAFAKKYYLDSATGTFINRNHFATMLAIALPFSLALALPDSTRRRHREASWRERVVAAADSGGLGRLLAVAASSLIWLGVLLSHSRAGLAATAVGASIVLFRFRSTKVARWAGAIGAGVLLVLLTVETAQAPGERFLTLKDDIQHKEGRPTVWLDAIGLVTSRPVLGWGFGTFESVFPTVQSEDIELHYDHAHSDWLEWSTEGGLVALGVAITLLAGALRNTWRTTRTTGLDSSFPIACAAAIAALAVHAAWDFSLRIPAVAATAAALMGIALARLPMTATEKHSTSVFPATRGGERIRERIVDSVMTTPRSLRWTALAAVVVLLCATAVVAVASFREGRHVATPRADVVARVWLGPKGPALESVIDVRLRDALAALEDPNREAAKRVPAYQSELKGAKVLLRRALLANVADTKAIQRLAAVEWELGVLDGTPDETSVAALVAVAGTRAPRVPEIQVELGDTLYRLGNVEDAKPFMARAVLLSPATARRVVGIMLGAGVEPFEVLRSLPPVPDVLVALAPEFSSRRRGAELLPVLEEHLHGDSPQLIETYGNLAMSLQQVDRLQSHLSNLGQLGDPHAEAERQLQLGRVSVSRGEWDAAFGFASAALALWPVEPRYCEFAAATALDSDHLSEAETILRDGLARLAVIAGTNGWRARFYRGLGEVFERRGRGDDALVYYRRALEQDPSEYVARVKVAQVESLLAPKDAPHP